MRLVVRPLSVALHLVLGTTLAGSNALAQAIAPPTPENLDTTTYQDDSTLPVIRVSALALGEETNKIAAPFSIVDRDQALQGGQSTLGDILNGLPGVHSDNFGGGASRPVIRGQSAPRTKVLSDGSAVIDASDISPDHATTVDPLLARRIEVLRGPATLLYGGGAIGGVVNVLDNKIPSAMPEGGIAASLVVRGNTVARERAAAVEMTAQLSSHLAFHIESSSRSAADYRVPDWTESHVDGSFAESANSSAGLSWITPNGHVGLAYSLRNDNYGLPGHAHEYENCHPHGSSLHCDGDDHEGHDHGDEDDHEDAPKVDLISKRFDLRGEYRDPFAGASRIRFRASHTDYRHDEIDAGEIATTFRNKGHEERIEIEHVPLGNWTGVVGIQHADTTFSADGAEAFMPTSQTRSTGVFAVEHYHLNDAWHFELGARHEWQKIEAINDPRMRPKLADTTTALSAAAIWEFVPNYTLSLSTARSERLPQAQELYARGVHLATNTYECGLLPSSFTCGGVDNDATVKKETSTNVELSLRKTMGDVMFNVAGFVNAVDNYIYARTLDQYEDFRLIKYSQRDAKFIGFEGEATWQFSNIFSATFFGDRVNARFDDGGGNLPRIPARRVGARLQGDWQAWSGELELYRVASQDHIADYETRSPSYRMLNLGLSYQLDEDGKRSVFVRANNLLNEQVWNHSSFLAGVIPLPGRNVSAGFKLAF